MAYCISTIHDYSMVTASH